MVGVNEFYTSKKCPTCKEFVAQTENIRRLYCPKCEKYLHRDVMAGHNMCNALRSHLESGERPDYLQPVDAEGNHLWKRQEQQQVQRQVPVTGYGQKRRACMEENEVMDGRARKGANGGRSKRIKA